MKTTTNRKKILNYFAGTERLASAIGNGGLADIGNVNGTSLADKRMERDSLLRRVMAPYPLRINRNRLDTLYSLTRPDTTAELTYFFHPDHLGSASWITDLSGQPVQHLQYKPFGGDYINQQDPNTEYSERFRFTGKERDAETGYDYFGARYYSSSLGIWLSVDPMSDKYPSLSPYVYCADNPVNAIDPDGKEIKLVGSEKERKIILANLQKLTNDKLSMRTDGTVIITRIGGENSGKYLKTGSELIRDLNKKGDGAKIVTISIGKNGNNESHKKNQASSGIKVDSNVTFDPSSNPLIMTKDPITNNVSKEKRPSEIGLGHELIHAHRAMNGNAAQGTIEHIYKNGKGEFVKKTIPIEEAETVGLQGDYKFTENKLRTEQGLKERGTY